MATRKAVRLISRGSICLVLLITTACGQTVTVDRSTILPADSEFEVVFSGSFDTGGNPVRQNDYYALNLAVSDSEDLALERLVSQLEAAGFESIPPRGRLWLGRRADAVIALREPTHALEITLPEKFEDKLVECVLSSPDCARRVDVVLSVEPVG